MADEAKQHQREALARQEHQKTQFLRISFEWTSRRATAPDLNPGHVLLPRQDWSRVFHNTETELAGLESNRAAVVRARELLAMFPSPINPREGAVYNHMIQTYEQQKATLSTLYAGYGMSLTDELTGPLIGPAKQDCVMDDAPYHSPSAADEAVDSTHNSTHVAFSGNVGLLVDLLSDASLRSLTRIHTDVILSEEIVRMLNTYLDHWDDMSNELEMRMLYFIGMMANRGYKTEIKIGAIENQRSITIVKTKGKEIWTDEYCTFEAARNAVAEDDDKPLACKTHGCSTNCPILDGKEAKLLWKSEIMRKKAMEAGPARFLSRQRALFNSYLAMLQVRACAPSESAPTESSFSTKKTESKNIDSRKVEVVDAEAEKKTLSGETSEDADRVDTPIEDC
ncbi:hypothetical protein P280DRAFT_518130 [Massarina eburnea CBS 473.64]|uniref:Uncharacterized protein n=1 Tax=Massarina eburnea CBS 473.64 TaxID=1395130 RepID=A0A6A6S0S5_9PLEO|nr:hypothetical protein P280DRAFT_518130 [Massarina eburnea CBS 473.64]